MEVLEIIRDDDLTSIAESIGLNSIWTKNPQIAKYVMKL